MDRRTFLAAIAAAPVAAMASSAIGSSPIPLSPRDKFLQSTARTRMLVGGNRCGKSTLAAYDAARHFNMGASVLVTSGRCGQVSQAMLPLMLKFAPSHPPLDEAKSSHDKCFVSFPSNPRIVYGGSFSRGILDRQYDYIWIDEETPSDYILELLERDDKPRVVWSTWPSKDARTLATMKAFDERIHMSTCDNPGISRMILNCVASGERP